MRLFEPAKKAHWSGSRALVALPKDVCPECGGPLDDESIEQAALLRHGGYGATERTITRHCRCGFRLVFERTEVRP